MALQFLCMKWGNLYGPEYVNRLYTMIAAHSGGEFRLVCLTDDAEGIRPEVECLPCPEIALPMPYCRAGWRKLTTFAGSESLYGLTGEWLFLDLDVVICGGLDEFFAFRPDEPFVVMQNWTQPGKGIGNTSVYRFRVGALAHILEGLLTDVDGVLDRYSNSQTYISRVLGMPIFWPDDWCVLFKVQCVPPWPRRFWRVPRIPLGARIVAFPGVPNPHEAVEGQWPAKWYKRFYKYVRPTPWIANLWDGNPPALGGNGTKSAWAARAKIKS